jgi:hypothetical protein
MANNSAAGQRDRADQIPLFNACQRWNQHRASYRPAGEPIDPTRYHVAPVAFSEAKKFVVTHHYSATMPATQLAIGMYAKPSRFRAAELAGVVVFSVPIQEAAIPAWLDGLPARQGTEIGRCVLRDEVPANGETFLLGRAFRALRAALPGVKGVLSYCDPLERTDSAGNVVKRGHVGTIYRAHNGRLLGRSSPRTMVLSRDGRTVCQRALSKIRGGEQGADYATRQLVTLGAPARAPFEDGTEYVKRALREGGFRATRHPGNLVFGWAL